ncbi:hypothetical protein EOJ36_04850 [Sandaracinomonas limnophila]|jgi:hypothetical protein|uniref:Uncharacterized protein n=1 Tax=Sandaracinomonas limnophila TaxID=1862386 RepID=A0A437PU37_9BACT|nr:hypothetical protein [Sandaracinomonas limnophila]RVU25748.1 hypothetical protein EOJ36_04850 [Sandaracinomonas limnophila]
MKRVLTIYAIFMAILFSQDAVQLYAQKYVEILAKKSISLVQALDNTSEDLEDSFEDEGAEDTFEAFATNQVFNFLNLSYPIKFKINYKDLTLRSIYLDKITPPPQV